MYSLQFFSCGTFARRTSARGKAPSGAMQADARHVIAQSRRSSDRFAMLTGKTELECNRIVVRSCHGSVNFACFCLPNASKKSPVDVVASFEEMACGSSSHTSRRHCIAETSPGQCPCYAGLRCV